jgi:AraC-like DNA-binding protein
MTEYDLQCFKSLQNPYKVNTISSTLKVSNKTILRKFKYSDLRSHNETTEL